MCDKVDIVGGNLLDMLAAKAINRNDVGLFEVGKVL